MPCNNPDYGCAMQNPFFRHLTDRMQDKLLFLNKFYPSEIETVVDLCASVALACISKPVEFMAMTVSFPL